MKFFQLLLFLIVIGCSTNSSAQTVYTTKTGEKYHTENCRYLKYSKKEINLQDAIDRGYQACSVCKPGLTPDERKKTNSLYNSQESSNAPEQTNTHATASQCTGKTKSGNRCKRMTKNANRRCYQH